MDRSITVQLFLNISLRSIPIVSGWSIYYEYAY